jgi:hypothetical protein
MVQHLGTRVRSQVGVLNVVSGRLLEPILASAMADHACARAATRQKRDTEQRINFGKGMKTKCDDNLRPQIVPLT